jgi:hypothetical protein
MAKTRSSGRTTIDRAEIRRWVESKGGRPAHVKGTERGDDPGVLRIDFPGYGGVETLKKLSWDEWFEWFDKNDLALLYQPSTRLSKLIARDSATLGSRTRATPRRTGGAKRATTAKRSTAKRTTKKPTARAAPQRGATASRGAKKRGATTKRRGATKRPAAKRTTAKRTTKRGSAKRSAR